MISPQKIFFLLLLLFQLAIADDATLKLTTKATNSAKPANNFLIDLTWASQYLWDGFKVGDSPVWEVALKARLFESGFSVMLWAALQTAQEQKQFDENDFFLLYAKDFFQDEKYKINFHGYYDYWIFPNTKPVRDEFGDIVSDTKRRGNKFQAGISLLNYFPLQGSFVIPTYNVYHWLYYEQDRADLKGSGQRHELLVEYDRSIAVFIPHADYQYAGAATSLNYHKGVFGVTPGFSHLTSTLRSGVYALKSIFEVSLNHQWSFEKTVNPNNALWTTASFIKKF